MAKSYLDHDGLAYFWDLIKSKLAQKMNISDAVTGVKGSSESAYRKGDVNITSANIGLGNVTNNKQVIGNASGTVQQHLVEWGSDGYHLQDSGLTINDFARSNTVVTGVKGNSESTYRKGDVNITPTNIGLGNLTNNKQVKGLSSGTTSGHVVTWGTDGYTVADSGTGIYELLEKSDFMRYGYIPVCEVQKSSNNYSLEIQYQFHLQGASASSDTLPTSSIDSNLLILKLSNLLESNTRIGMFSHRDSNGTSTLSVNSYTYAFYFDDNVPLVDQYDVGTYLLMYRSGKEVNGQGQTTTINWRVIADVGIRYTAATQSADGLMSSADKQKLDGVSTIPYVATSNMAAGAALTGVCQDLTELTEGQSIILHLSYPAGSNATLNLTLADGTTTGAKDLYYGGTTRLGTQYAAGNDIRLTYHEGISIAGSGLYTGWWAEGNRDTTYSNATTSKAGLMSATDKIKLDKFSDADDYALKTDISTMYKYKGSVANLTALGAVSEKEVGDVYNVETDGGNYAWNGAEWDSLGGIFEMTSITQAQIDAIVAS